MPSPLATYSSQALHALLIQWIQAPLWAKTFAVITATSVSGLVTIRVVDDFRQWKAMGPGGPPHNLVGYLIATILGATFAKSDTRSLKPYREPERTVSGFRQASEHEKTQARRSFCESLPEREGPRSYALPYVVPQRERIATASVKSKAYKAAYNKLAAEYASVVEWRTSVLERRGQAMFLKPGIAVSSLAAATKGEISHIHMTDLSGHVTLSLADAEEVVAKGWGERHCLSGVVLPLTYTMLYVPRTIDEVESFVKIFRAGIDYMRSNEQSA